MRWLCHKSCIRPTLVGWQNIEPHGEQLHTSEGPISLALLALSGSLSRFLAPSLFLSLAATLSAHPPPISPACSLFLFLLTLSMFMLSLCAEQQTIATAGCFGLDVTCGCCRPDSDFSLRPSPVTDSNGNETGMKLNRKISVDPPQGTTEEEEATREINEIGNAMQVPPPL
jgi:hypothetical protein